MCRYCSLIRQTKMQCDVLLFVVVGCIPYPCPWSWQQPTVSGGKFAVPSGKVASHNNCQLPNCGLEDVNIAQSESFIGFVCQNFHLNPISWRIVMWQNWIVRYGFWLTKLKIKMQRCKFCYEHQSMIWQKKQAYLLIAPGTFGH